MIELLQPIFITFWGIICFYGIIDLCYDLNSKFCSCCRKTIKTKNIYLINKDSEKYIDKVCPICLENFTKDNIPYTISFCQNDSHPFHQECVSEYFRNNSFSCPVCRRITDTEI